MKLHIINDLHIDMDPEFAPVLPGGEVLVLAGDLCEARRLKMWDDDHNGVFEGKIERLPKHDKDRINKWIATEFAKYDHVIYVMGNHEFYNFTFNKTLAHIKDNMPANVHVLEKNSFELDGVLFVGATMWTDCHNGDPLTMHAVKYGMNDFEVIRVRRFNDDYVRFTVQDAMADHLKAKQYFETIFQNPLNLEKKIVVVTHHAPTHMSIDDRYAHDYLLNGGYYSKLDDLILDNPAIKLWCHGHTHMAKDYMVGDHTRVICNPRGYVGRYQEEYTGWDPNLTIEI
jgi:Icc-related predicted phosphoesterase